MVTWTRETATRFFQKAGFGPAPGDVDRALAEGAEATIQRLLNDDRLPTSELDARLASYHFDFTTLDGMNYDLFVGLQRWWYLRMLYSPRQLEEKLTLFWHMHFATSYEKVDLAPLLYAQNNIFRRLGRGLFGDLLLNVSKDPAMLVWLDNDTNVREHPNENFAREVMELFTLGIGHYSQRDVTEAARAFTGWTFNPDTYAFYFDTASHDEGTKTVLGTTGSLRGEDVVALLAARSETAEFLAAKLARFFVGLTPSPALIATLRNAYLSSGGSIRMMLDALFHSEDFLLSLTVPRQVKTPTELMIGALRALGVQTDATPIPDFGFLAGQAVYLPPNVAGWKGGLRWINTGSYLVRMNLANELASSRPGNPGASLPWDPALFFTGATIRSADDLIDTTADRLGMPRPVSSPRQALLTFVAGATAVPFTWNRETADRAGRGLVHLLLASPAAQLQ
jgi:uncharacterized protein (DUF1800 family)